MRQERLTELLPNSRYVDAHWTIAGSLGGSTAILATLEGPPRAGESVPVEPEAAERSEECDARR